MNNRVLLVMATACVFAFASPSYATFWNSHNGGGGFNWSGNNWSNHSWNDGGDRDNKRTNWRSNDCDWAFDWDWDCDDRDDRWCDDDRDDDCDDNSDRWCDDNWFDCDDKQWDFNCDWDRKDCDDKDWSWDWDCDRDWKDCDDRQPPRCDNPVPEPATAGLAFMGMGALVAATRRRRK